MTRFLAAAAIALALCAPVTAYADDDADFAAAIKADPCFAPMPDTPDTPRIGAMAVGISVEAAALGASKNPAAEARAMAAIKDDIATMTEAMNARDLATSSALMCKFHALTDAELARQLAGETSNERARIATFLRDGKAALTQSLNPELEAEEGAGEARVAEARAAEEAARKAIEKQAADKAEADRPRIEAEAKAKVEAERAQIEADAKAKVRAQIEADLRAKAEAEAKAKAEADAKDDTEAAERAKYEAAAQFKVAEEARMEAEAVARNEDNARAAKMAHEASVRADKEAAEVKASEDARIAAEAKARHEANVRDAKVQADAAARATAAHWNEVRGNDERADDNQLAISCVLVRYTQRLRQRELAQHPNWSEYSEDIKSGEISCDVLRQRGAAKGRPNYIEEVCRSSPACSSNMND